MRAGKHVCSCARRVERVGDALGGGAARARQRGSRDSREQLGARVKQHRHLAGHSPCGYRTGGVVLTERCPSVVAWAAEFRPYCMHEHTS